MIVEQVDTNDPLGYWKESVLGLLLDDPIWLWSIAAERFNSECPSIGLDRPEDIVLSSMLCVGLHDWSEGQ